MRCLGEIQGRKPAERFVAHLLTQGVATHIETLGQPADDHWEIWVRDEDRLDFASAELAHFQQNPLDAKYASAVAKASQLMAEKQKKRQQAAKNVHRIDPSPRSPMMGRGGRTPPLTLTLILLCIFISVLSSFSNPAPSNEWGVATKNQLSFVDPQDAIESQGNPAASIEKGEIWRIITPIFMHGDPMHLALNLFGLFVFGRVLERLMGTPKFAIFVLLLAIIPNLLQGLAPPSWHGNPNFVGISGVVYGFLGYVWIRSTLNPRFAIRIPTPFVILAVGMILVGLSGAVPNWHYADLCHLGGLLVGGGLGYASEQANSRS
ncbi:rhomboid family intramembrane serine protease [Aureliella helgolandensis]|uniref:Rhomboid protease GlpG n=1 Tax=Aureliella helgolandensis TaxID=2527968 RepID=A0A518G767_9BACT|nr:rhomboid family intramembrane serine protease [Aureliella helgolandensis]QDV24428.1 Rhomboid protease GlpG [Aureliella helgolandensis]